nr:MAG TPA: ATP synthase [Crassvirales sp.]
MLLCQLVYQIANLITLLSLYFVMLYRKMYKLVTCRLTLDI